MEYEQLTLLDIEMVGENGVKIFPPDDLIPGYPFDEGFLESWSLLKNSVYAVERNAHGAWVVYGEIGVHQYYYCTKQEAVKLYRKKCEDTDVPERRTHDAMQS